MGQLSSVLKVLPMVGPSVLTSKSERRLEWAHLVVMW